jgi:surfactin synthase thioesterase subunit
MTDRQPKTTDWFVATAPRPSASVRMVAFPPAGGGCSAFAQQARTLPPWLEMLTLNMPGRQARYSEPLRTDLAPLIQELTGACSDIDSPYLMFGYCSGALLAYLVARALKHDGARLPERLVVGSLSPPHLVSTPILANMSSDKLWEVLTTYQAVPPEMAAEPEFRELAEPVLRADFALIEGDHRDLAEPLPVPVTVLVGARDETLTPEAVSSWAQYTTEPLRVTHIQSGHWFMEEDPAAGIAALVAEAEQLRAHHQ